MIFSNHRSIFTAVLTSDSFINIDSFLRNLKHGELKELNLATLKRDTYAYLICYIFIFFEKKENDYEYVSKGPGKFGKKGNNVESFVSLSYEKACEIRKKETKFYCLVKPNGKTK